MTRSAIRLLSVLALVSLVLAACGSDDGDDDAGSTTTASTTEAELGEVAPDAQVDYCEVVRANPDPSPEEAIDLLPEWIKVAPPELEADLQELEANVDLVEGGLTPEEQAQIQEPLERVITYHVQKCGIPFDLDAG